MGGMAAGLRGKCRDRVGGRGGRRRRTEGGGRGAEGAGPRGCDTGRGGLRGFPDGTSTSSGGPSLQQWEPKTMSGFVDFFSPRGLVAPTGGW